MVRLQGACLGGRGKDRSWQATTRAPGRGGKESQQGLWDSEGGAGGASWREAQ